MERRRIASDDAAYDAMRAKLGEAIRCQYDLARPLPDRLYLLVRELERRADELKDPKAKEVSDRHS